MRKVIGAIAVLLILWTAPIAASDRVFRDLRWGDPVTALGPGARRVENPGLGLFDELIQCWVQNPCNFRLGPIRATAIYFGFCQNRLTCIVIITPKMRFQALCDIARAKYGAPVDEKCGSALPPSVVTRSYVYGDTRCIVTIDPGDAGLAVDPEHFREGNHAFMILLFHPLVEESLKLYEASLKDAF